MEVKATLKALPDKNVQIGKARDGKSSDFLKGLRVSELNDELREQYKLPADLKGILVSQIEAGSPASEAGLRPGMVILQINRRSVESIRDAEKILTKIKGNALLLLVWYKNRQYYSVVNLPKEKRSQKK